MKNLTEELDKIAIWRNGCQCLECSTALIVILEKRLKVKSERSELKSGDIVMCWDLNGHRRSANRFIGMADSGRYITEIDDIIKVWNFAEKIQEKQWVPYTQDTFPKGNVWLMPDNEDVYIKPNILGVNGFRSNGAGVCSYSELLDDYMISLDECKTWQKAGIEQ